MSCNHKKNPLTLMEVPENGLIYEYGVPISKSLKPATVKQVQCLKENSKWVWIFVLLLMCICLIS